MTAKRLVKQQRPRPKKDLKYIPPDPSKDPHSHPRRRPPSLRLRYHTDVLWQAAWSVVEVKGRMFAKEAVRLAGWRRRTAEFQPGKELFPALDNSDTRTLNSYPIN
jgi:hypothetical protein